MATIKDTIAAIDPVIPASLKPTNIKKKYSRKSILAGTTTGIAFIYCIRKETTISTGILICAGAAVAGILIDKAIDMAQR